MSKLAFALIAAMLFVPAASAQQYGAIAYSPDSGASGYATRNSKLRAEQWAMYYCNQNANDCRVVSTFHKACGAVAQGENGGWGSTSRGANQSQAQNRALAACSEHDDNCQVTKWVCSAR